MDDFTKIRIKKIMDKYTEAKIPKHLQNQMRLIYKIRGNNVTLLEERPAYRGEGWTQRDLVQFRLDGQGEWKVYWRDSKDKWHWVEDIEANKDFEQQLMIVDQDNRGIFWG
ncbi:Protein of unknown function [Paenibacillus sp. UNCCL117]|uniref:DUF3024 domain-containing protein n=1 Tax=unclassified Paenibacillus TaxID=185978 RepID=UPI00088B4DCE|nr:MULTISPECIES: DUF3024 domain-containing protein [unclassified Paenibacillus]SDE43231.1 Protein of unknown function [Paenibacillus sp. cl123]SFW45942.1 Protein of unknown function [Paenibacillus sp. UNCCL117]